ncbi:heme ABC exporter ATP-binding protein CcmA [Bartonella sp. HY406]|uniref:heme ABC exporter ATP-binding protein CcmA n=1 Tax=Bartonella sp. HY406 TaxID=2979331 RepID=UPI0021C806C6|nr:heme ABC exporter ATP-binding protein CcmA [Bartonella sp. HY406]UXN03216.1 heme ABC exporter ATP-binding protein CcmA [Bartonella sp. HY406]
MQLIGENLSIERGGEILFSSVNFLLEENQLLVITGANGAGKSTLLRIIAGLLSPLCGTIKFFDGVSHFEVAPFAHYLGEKNAMKPHLSVAANLKFWARFYQPSLTASAIQSLIENALDRLNLRHVIDLPFGVLSTGQRRRIAICRLLLDDRVLWIIDEPTSGLDSAASDIFSALMQEHLDNKGMIIAATHLPLGIDTGHNLVLEPFTGNDEAMK